MDLLHAIAAELIAKEKINEEEFNKFFYAIVNKKGETKDGRICRIYFK